MMFTPSDLSGRADGGGGAVIGMPSISPSKDPIVEELEAGGEAWCIEASPPVVSNGTPL